jgi:hypothetical protein
MASAIASGQVTIQKGSQNAVLPITITNHTGSVTFPNIQVGHWSVSVALFDANGVEIYSGQGDAVVHKDQTTSLKVRVSPNTGNLEIIVDVPWDEQVIFRHGIGQGLWTVNPDGSDPNMLIPEDTDWCASEPSTYRNGTSIVFVGHHPTGDHHCGIYICNRDGSGTHRLDLPPLRHPRFSWNGDKLAAGTMPNGDERQGDIVTFNPDGSGLTALAQGWTPVWTPDGRIIFAQENAIRIIHADGSNVQTLLEGLPVSVIADCSPDLRVTFNVDSGGQSIIHMVNLDGSNHQILTPDGVSSDWGRFNADGSKIVFDRNKDVYLMNADGSDQRCIFSSEDQDEGSACLY